MLFTVFNFLFYLGSSSIPVDLPNEKNLLEQWEYYLKKFNKTYSEQNEYTGRFEIFKKNIQTIQTNNLILYWRTY
jgi:hypothetical protein